MLKVSVGSPIVFDNSERLWRIPYPQRALISMQAIVCKLLLIGIPQDGALGYPDLGSIFKIQTRLYRLSSLACAPL